MYHRLRAAGRGPKEMRLGLNLIRITAEAERDWQLRMQEPNADFERQAEQSCEGRRSRGQEREAHQQNATHAEQGHSAGRPVPARPCQTPYCCGDMKSKWPM